LKHIFGSRCSELTQLLTFVLNRLAELGVTDFTMYTPDVMNGEHKVRVTFASLRNRTLYNERWVRNQHTLPSIRLAWCPYLKTEISLFTVCRYVKSLKTPTETDSDNRITSHMSLSRNEVQRKWYKLDTGRQRSQSYRPVRPMAVRGSFRLRPVRF
jgi:hypothetical protein